MPATIETQRTAQNKKGRGHIPPSRIAIHLPVVVLIRLTGRFQRFGLVPRGG